MKVRTVLKAGQTPGMPVEPPETNMSFNQQYLQLQDPMQQENRAFTVVSNVMSQKHDTAANTIGNIR